MARALAPLRSWCLFLAPGELLLGLNMVFGLFCGSLEPVGIGGPLEGNLSRVQNDLRSNHTQWGARFLKRSLDT